MVSLFLCKDSFYLLTIRYFFCDIHLNYDMNCFHNNDSSFDTDIDLATDTDTDTFYNGCYCC